MLRFIGRQTAIHGMTIRPGRLYSVEVLPKNERKTLLVFISDGYRAAMVPYGSIESFMENWAAANDSRFK